MKYLEMFDCYIDDDFIIYCYPTAMDKKHPQGKLFQPSKRIDSDGYYHIKIRGKDYLLHRVIAMVFLPNPKSLPYIDHINRIRMDNRLENLRWATAKQNSDSMGYVLAAQERYSIRACDDKNAYYREYYKAHPGKHTQYSQTYRKKKMADGYKRIALSNGKRKWVKK